MWGGHALLLTFHKRPPPESNSGGGHLLFSQKLASNVRGACMVGEIPK